MGKVTEFLKPLLKARLGRRVASGLIAFAVTMSPMYQTATVIASEIDQDTPTEVTDVAVETEVAATDAVVANETEYQEPELSETVIESVE